ncbi:MAG: cation diffusion facilitator family transporter [Planctomycetota bacterium]|nr:cation diffusion facilitator family transporter [Planctomycetota bacterium]
MLDNRRPFPGGQGEFDRLSRPDSRKLMREVSRTTWAGLGVNFVLAWLKAGAGLASGSRAILADAVHTLSDLASDAIILIGVRYWSAPADAEHPHGHRKIETMVTFALGLFLAAAGVGMGWRAASGLGGLAGTASGGYPGNPPARPFDPWPVLAAALLSVAAKEALYRWTAARGKRINSRAMIANAWHHRSDAFSSLPPALAAAAELVLGRNRDLSFLDDLGTLVVCVLLLQAAWKVVGPSFSTLIDAGADRRLSAAIRGEILATPGVAGAHRIRTRAIGGGGVEVDLHIAVEENLTVRDGHEIAARVKYRILAIPPSDGMKVVDVMVHVEPTDGDRG